MGPVDTVDGTFDMTAVGSRLFAVGFVPGEDDRQNGVVLTSDDGVNWVRLAVNDPALTVGAVLMYAAAEGGPGLVAVGVGCEAETGECALRATAWTSIDGTSWTRTPEDAAAFGDGTTQTSGMAGVADTSHGLVAVGSMKYWTFDDEGVEELVTIHPAAWISDDGITWERSWEGTGSAVDPNELNKVHVTMDSVVEGPDGLLVGVGATLDENGIRSRTVWTSRDGRQWGRIEPGTAVFTPGTVMLDVALGEHGYVAVGSDGGTNAAIWQSPDGVTWARIERHHSHSMAYGRLTPLPHWMPDTSRSVQMRSWCNRRLGDGMDIPRRCDLGSDSEHCRGIRIRSRGRRRRHRGLRRDT